MIGDVSGKGIPAAIYMAVSRTLLKAIAHQIAHPGEVLRKLNTMLIPESEEATFVTIFYAILNTRTGEVQYSNGGHNPPYLLKASGEVQQLASTDGFILGKISQLEFDTAKVKLEPGDTLFLYTDGVTEAMDKEANQYEEHRLEKFLGMRNGSTIEELIKGSFADVKKFVDGAPQADDITVLAVRYQQS